MSKPKTYEVTIPVTVYITSDGGHHTIDDIRVEDGFPGFFSEAEEAMGCWNPRTEQWDESERAFQAASFAQRYTYALLRKVVKG